MLMTGDSFNGCAGSLRVFHVSEIRELSLKIIHLSY